MRTRIAALVSAAVAAGFTAAVAPGAQAGAGGPTPLDPAAAAALVSAVPTVASGSTLRRITAVEALAAASIPGASVWVAPGLSLQQAVGASATQQALVAAAATTSTSTPCWANAAWRQWGTWPYEQKITDTTYWCAVYGVRITYRSSTTTAGGTLCGVSWRSSQLVAGGIGYSWFTIRASAGFACPTVIPWVTLHPSHYEDTARNAWGGTSAVGSG